MIEVKSSIIESIGSTPMVEVAAGFGPGVRILAKLEWHNPGGSVKDRVALNIINKGFSSGQLRRDMTVLEASTGSMGVSMGLVCAAFGLRLELIMPEDTPETFIRLAEGFGARLSFTPAQKGIDEALRRAYNRFDSAPETFFLANHFNNGANPQAHYETTGPEIIRQAKGRVTHFVAGMGTTGTLMGAGRRLRREFPGVQIIGVEPVKGHHIHGLRSFQDIILPGVYDLSKLDQILKVNDDQAAEALDILHKNGILAGPSSGAAMHGALQTARKAPPGSTIVTVFPDSAERHPEADLLLSR